MAFPTIQTADTKNGTVTSNSNSWTLTYPTNIAAGDLLLAFIATDGTGFGAAPPADWVASSQFQSGTAVEGRVFAKKAVGSETGTFIVSGSTSEQGGWRVFRITGWEGTLAQASLGNAADGEAVAVAGLATGTNANPNPLSVDPANWATEDTLWLAACFVDTSRTISVYPLAGNNTADVSGGAGGATLGLCTTTSAVASLDVGTFTISSADDWASVVVAVRPAAAGADIAPVLSGTGSLSAAPQIDTPVAPALSGTGDLTAAPTIEMATFTAALSGSGDLTANAVPEIPATAALSGAGTLSGVIDYEVNIPAALSGTGDLSGALRGETPIAPTLSGTGDLSATLSGETPLASNLTGSGDLAADLVPHIPTAASLSGSGDLSASVVHEVPLTAALSGAGDLTADVVIVAADLSLAAALTGTGTLTADLTIETPAVPSLSGSGTLASDVQAETPLTSTLSADGTLSGDPSIRTPLSVALSGSGDLAADSSLQTPLDATLSGTGDLSAAPQLDTPIAASLNGSGDLAATLEAETAGEVAIAAALSGTGSLTASLDVPAVVTPEAPPALGGGGGNLRHRDYRRTYRIVDGYPARFVAETDQRVTRALVIVVAAPVTATAPDTSEVTAATVASESAPTPHVDEARGSMAHGVAIASGRVRHGEVLRTRVSGTVHLGELGQARDDAEAILLLFGPLSLPRREGELVGSR